MKSGLGFAHDHRIAVGVVLVLLLTLNVVFVLAVARRSDSAGAPGTPGASVSLPSPISERWFVALQPADSPRFPGQDQAYVLAIRARSGTCTTRGATVERSVDGGRTWLDVTDELNDLVLIRRALVDNTLGARIVGPRTDCESDLWSSIDGGLSWDWNGDQAGIWFLRDGPSPALHAPLGVVTSPCSAQATVRDVTDDGLGNGIVLCSDGAVLRSQGEAGAAWDPLGTVPDAWSVTFSAESGYVTAKQAGCLGVQVLSWAGGKWNPVSCVADVAAAGSAISIRGQLGLLVSFSGTWRSEDAGVTWTPVP